MTIELSTAVSPAVSERTIKAGSEDIIIPAGKGLKIETFPNGVEVLNFSPENGLSWSAHVDVTLVRTDT